MSPWMLRLLFIGLLALPGICPANSENNGLLEIFGDATDLKTGQPLYLEHHYQLFKEGRLVDHHVEYKRPNGSILATKTLDYSKNPYAPDFRLRDWRDGYIEGGRSTAEGYLLELRPDKDQPLKTDVLNPASKYDLIADAGFDQYVRAKLTELQQDKSHSFILALASRLSSYRFQAKPVYETRLFGQPALKIRIQLANLLRLLADSIDITYDLETGNLLRYEGMSNIRDENGERYDARIDFDPDKRRFTAYGLNSPDQLPERTPDHSGL